MPSLLLQSPVIRIPSEWEIQAAQDMSKKAAAKRASCQAEIGKENQEEKRSQPLEKSSDRPPTLRWENFVLLLKEYRDHACELDAFIVEPDRAPLVPVPDSHCLAAAVSKVVWETTGYRFK
jgi:hypothetical protein